MKRKVTFIILIFTFFFILIKPKDLVLNAILDIITDLLILSAFYLAYSYSRYFTLLLGLLLSIVIVNIDVIKIRFLVNQHTTEIVNDLSQILALFDILTIPLFVIGFIPLYPYSIINRKVKIENSKLIYITLIATLIFQFLLFGNR